MTSSPSPEKKRALIVDDEKDICELIEFFLVEHFQCKSASDPSLGLQLLEQEKFDCVISDYRMNEISGVDILNAANKMNPPCQKVLITGAINTEETELFNYEVQVITKPFNDPEDFVRKILSKGKSEKN